jgi:hypothetical protein
MNAKKCLKNTSKLIRTVVLEKYVIITLINMHDWIKHTLDVTISVCKFEKIMSTGVTLFRCCQVFQFDNMNDSASPKFIKLNLLIRENKYGIIPHNI